MENNEFNNMEVVPQEQINPEPPKKKSKAPLIVLLCVVMIGIGVCTGYFVPKLLNKNDKKEDTKVEEKKEEEPVVEEPVEEPKQEEKPVEYKISRNDVVKESSLDITLNGVTYKLETVYYKSKKNLMKDVYFNKVNIIKESMVAESLDSKIFDSKIKEDIEFIKKTNTRLNDTKSKDQYLVYYNKYRATITDEWYEPEVFVYVFNKEGKSLYSRWTLAAGHSDWLMVENKADVLDRQYYVYSCGDDVDDEEVDEYCGLYVLYNGIEGEPYDDKGTNVEFKESYFYAYESGYMTPYINGKKDDSGNNCDWKYYVENGVVKKTKLNSSNGISNGAGAE